MTKKFYLTDYETGEFICELTAWWISDDTVRVEPSESFWSVMLGEREEK